MAVLRNKEAGRKYKEITREEDQLVKERKMKMGKNEEGEQGTKRRTRKK